jgi:serine/threonine protein kinase
MERCEMDLEKYCTILKQEGALTDDIIWFIFQEILQGMVFMQLHTIVHRDIKLKNILVKLKNKE